LERLSLPPMRLFALALLVAAVPARAQDLTVPQIMAWGDTLASGLPNLAGWSETGDWLYFRWNPNLAADDDSLYRVRRGSTQWEKAPQAEQLTPPETFGGWQHGEGVYSSDWSQKIYTRGGDVFVMDRRTGRETALTRTREFESGARLMAGDTAVVYARGDNLFRHSLATGGVVQLTDIRSGNEPSEPKPDAQQAYLDRQQRALFGYVREREAEREAREAARTWSRTALGEPRTVYAGGDNVGQLRIDPAGRYVTFTRTPSARTTSTDVPFWITDDGYTSVRPMRPKVGHARSAPTLYVHDLARDTVYAADLSALPRLYDAPAFRPDTTRLATSADSARARRDVSLFGPMWSPDGRYALLDIRAYDNKTRWIARLDAQTGLVAALDVQQDDAWIGGPGIPWWSGAGTMGWYPDGRHFFVQSEETGYSHLYRIDAQTGAKTALTSGAFEVSEPGLSRDGQTLTFASTEHSAHERHRYSMPATGGPRTRLTELRGHHDVAPDPRDELIAQTYAASNQPPEVYVQTQAGSPPQRVTQSAPASWGAQAWNEAEIVTIPASDGAQVPARIYRPEAHGADANGAAVLFVHGAGYLHNVHYGWSTYHREWMFHHLLAEQGYTVLDLDYRASAGYGRDWRTAIYRHMGGRDLQDYVDASRWVESEMDIDPERVFVYGGSYGGFITLMALFTEPEHFGGGAALRSVTDWAHYNHTYTSNILNTPAEDSLAYARSSPIEFAEGYEGDPLLIAHGMVDVNVQFQDVVRLAQRLIELGKEGWEMAVYPVEDHGFTEPASWTDEYRRILDYIEESVGPERER
jgi:dipeptidyl aminopeptidase/acylaminoacyl peptidase